VNGETLMRADVSDMLKSCYFPGKEKIGEWMSTLPLTLGSDPDPNPDSVLGP
jgi:hypothetical protein